MTTYPDSIPDTKRAHDGLCDYCKATGERPRAATRGALRGQLYSVGPAACDDHAYWLDHRRSTTEAWSDVDSVARASANRMAADWPLGSLAMVGATRAVGMVTAHGPATVRLLMPGVGEVSYDELQLTEVPETDPASGVTVTDLRDYVRDGARRRGGA